MRALPVSSALLDLALVGCRYSGGRLLCCDHQCYHFYHLLLCESDVARRWWSLLDLLSGKGAWMRRHDRGGELFSCPLCDQWVNRCRCQVLSECPFFLSCFRC